MTLNEIQHIFFQECEDGLATMEAQFAVLRQGDDDPETINTIFRAVHSVKGGAGAFGYERLQAFAHDYETLLDLIRKGSLVPTGDLLDTIVGAFDMLADHVAAAGDRGELPADAAMRARLAAASHPVEGGAGDGFDDLFEMLEACRDEHDAPAPWHVTFHPGASALDHGAEPLLLLRELSMLGATVLSADLTTLPPLGDLDPDAACIGWGISVPDSVTEEDVRAVFEFIDGGVLAVQRAGTTAPDRIDDVAASDCAAVQPSATTVAASPNEAPAEPVRAPAVAVAQTIRVDLDRLDRLVNLVGELVIMQSMLAQRLSDQALGGIVELADLEQLTRELQESTMAIRAQPMKTVFSRVPRIIRELEAETGKRVRLDVDGEMTEVDKTVIERIGEPLTHLIRNAVDHGLEHPDARIAAGKPAEDVVRLSAAHQSGRIVLTVADDGRGIDRERVRAKAVAHGIIAPDAVLSDEEIDNLIFAPGFSTAAAVTSVSGRGVGMDVVRKNVQALGGRIGIQSTLGVGSSFSLSLPLTLAVLDGMIVTVGDQTFVIPLGHIVESLRPAQGAIKVIGPTTSLLNVRGVYVPVHRVAERLGIDAAQSDPAEAVLIVVESDAGQAVLMVDGIQDQRQVVVKSLEANFRAVPSLAGATILGDGRVALILDVDALISRWRHDPRAQGPAPAGSPDLQGLAARPPALARDRRNSVSVPLIMRRSRPSSMPRPGS